VEIDWRRCLRKAIPRSGIWGAFWVQFEVAVPPGYNLEIKTDAGDIETLDIGGTATLFTQGGNIRRDELGWLAW